MMINICHEHHDRRFEHWQPDSESGPPDSGPPSRGGPGTGARAREASGARAAGPRAAALRLGPPSPQPLSELPGH
jgi:hypothetical protein